MTHLGRVDAERTELTTGFRVPSVIIDLANRILPHLRVPVAPARSMRSDGSVELVACSGVADGTVEAVEKALVEDGMIGVITPHPHIDMLRRVLPASDRVELVLAGLAKGLEFDHVIVVEPADFIDTPASGHSRGGPGLRQLYVALTRAVARLTMVHSRPLPAELGDLSPHT